MLKVATLNGKSLVSTLVVFSIYFTLSYFFLYYAYKYFIPDIVCVDFYNYYCLYKDFDVKSAITPFNMRLLNPLLVYFLNKTGLFYNTHIAFQNPEIDQHIFFCALVISYLAVLFTALVIYLTCNNYFKNKLFSFWMGVFYLMGGGTLLYCINPTTDSFSVFLLALIFKSYIEKTKWIYVLLPLAIFQREYIFMVIALIVLADSIFERKANVKNISIILTSIFCFAIYLIIRETILFTPTHTEQLNYKSYLSRILTPKINFLEFTRQGLFIQNILGIYFFVIIFKYLKKDNIVRKNILIILMLIFQILLISLMALLGNNIGRLFYMTIPIVLFYMAIEIYPLYVNFGSSNRKK